jgi:hypothetical protein
MPLNLYSAPAILLTGLAFPSAAAAIECDRQFQIVNGSKIATPYCGDQYLGQVARERGLQVSDSDIRQNDSTKTMVCARIGQDTRLRTLCTNHFPNPGSND